MQQMLMISMRPTRMLQSHPKRPIPKVTLPDEKNNGVVYEPSKETSKDTVTKTYTQNTNLVNKLKADADAHAKQLQSIVEKLMNQQGQTYNSANGIWSVLASGNLKVDAATQAQAKKDIAAIYSKDNDKRATLDEKRAAENEKIRKAIDTMRAQLPNSEVKFGIHERTGRVSNLRF